MARGKAKGKTRADRGSSWYAIGLGVAMIALLCYRAVLEEETLKRALDGYEAYTQRVRFRLIPGIF